MLKHSAKACASLAASLVWLHLVAAHVTLRYPLPGIRNGADLASLNSALLVEFLLHS